MASEPAMTKSAEIRSVDRSLIAGLAWTGAFRWLGQVVAWASTLVVARLLTPADYGIFGVGAIVLGLLTMLADFGIGSAVVILRNLSRHEIAQINTLSVLFGCGVFALACALAWPLGLFFGMPQAPAVIVVLSSTMVVTAFRTVPWSLLQKDLRFKRLAVFESVQVVGVAVLNVVLAWLGWGYWTLVSSAVASSVITTGLALRYHAHPFARPRFAALRETLRFSTAMIVQRVAWYAYTSADSIIVGRIFGPAILGAYGLALTLADTPVQKLNEVLSRVMPGVFSAVQTDNAALRRYVLGVTQAVSLAVFPACIGMSVVAGDFVRIVLGERWEPMIAPLRILAFYAAFKALSPVMGIVINTKRQLRFAAQQMVLAAVVMPCAFYAGTWAGIAGVAAAWVIVHPLVASRLYVRAARVIDLSFSEYARSLWPALSSTAIMACAVLAVSQSGVLANMRPFAGLAVTIAAGAGAYAAAIGLMHRSAVARLVSVLTAARAQA